MATSQHEGHANQLDLLIRAGNVIFRTRGFDLSCARLLFLSASAAPPSAEKKCGEVMEGNQEVITLVSNLHGVATRFNRSRFIRRETSVGCGGVYRWRVTCMCGVLHAGGVFSALRVV